MFGKQSEFFQIVFEERPIISLALRGTNKIKTTIVDGRNSVHTQSQNMSVANRERRKNAGRRMGDLLGKAVEEDDAFWSHETWNDGEDSGNDSFHESDEDSTLKKDVFDSDFDDSESDNEDDEVATGEAEEIELQKSERARRRQKSSTSYVDAANSSKKRGHNRGRKSANNKRVIGEGFNFGIVLNFPLNGDNSLTAQSDTNTLELISQSTVLQSTISTKMSTAATVVENKLPPSKFQTSPKKILPPNKKSNIPLSRVTLRERRSTHGERKLRENRGAAASHSKTTTTATVVSIGRKKNLVSIGSNSRASSKRKRYSQEELLSEAIHETEPKNQRWLHGRKRVQDQHDRNNKDLNSSLREKYKGKKVIQKFHSRRGCLNTLTFPEMDSVPEILTRRQTVEISHKKHTSSLLERGLEQRSNTICVITGKPCKYKDPLTNFPYYDVTAFKELRRRHENGIPMLKNSRTKVIHNNNFVEESKNEGEKSNTRNILLPPRFNHESTMISAKSVKKSQNFVTKGSLCASSKPVSTNNNKLPFQSPKPPSKPTTILSSIQQQSKEKLSKMESPTTSAVSLTTAVTNDISTSPSGRRLSPRKWKPSEKVLESICMSPEKDGVIVPPRGFHIKPLQLTTLTGLNINLRNPNLSSTESLPNGPKTIRNSVADNITHESVSHPDSRSEEGIKPAVLQITRLK